MNSFAFVKSAIFFNYHHYLMYEEYYVDKHYVFDDGIILLNLEMLMWNVSLYQYMKLVVIQCLFLYDMFLFKNFQLC